MSIDILRKCGMQFSRQECQLLSKIMIYYIWLEELRFNVFDDAFFSALTEFLRLFIIF